jgi:hypothetical protein
MMMGNDDDLGILQKSFRLVVVCDFFSCFFRQLHLPNELLPEDDLFCEPIAQLPLHSAATISTRHTPPQRQRFRSTLVTSAKEAAKSPATRLPPSPP